jgi:uroporphyrinogen III methyltransferase/synthase
LKDLANAEINTDSLGIVYLVGAGPGDPGLITVRGLECLQQAQVVVFDRLVSPLLRRHAPQAVWIDVGKQPDHHPIPQEEINALLVKHARSGRVVVRLKGGDPFVFGRGGEEALALVDAGIPFEVVPGVSSAVAVPAYAGIPVTQRGMAASLAVITGHRSQGIDDIAGALDCAALSAGTRVFLMGVTNLSAIVQRMIESGCSPDTPAAVIQEGTTSHQKVIEGTLENIVERAAEIQPPAIAIVGEVVRLRQKLRWFDLPQARPLLGLRILNTRPQASLDRDDLDERLANLGAEVLNLPATRIVPALDPSGLESAIHRLAQAAGQPGGYDWIVFTSANAVQFFFERIFALGYDARILPGVRLGAVGKATAQALAGYHLRADFTPTRFTGLDWAAQVGDLGGQRVLLPRSEIAPPDLVQALQAKGAQVETVVAYSVAPAEPDLQILQELIENKLDLAVFFSPSAVRGSIGMLEPACGREGALATLNRLTTACVGPTTSHAMEQAGVRVNLVAAEHTVEGLVEALVRWRLRS